LKIQSLVTTAAQVQLRKPLPQIPQVYTFHTPIIFSKS